MAEAQIEKADNGAERETTVDYVGNQQVRVRVKTGVTKTTYIGHYNKALPGYLDVVISQQLPEHMTASLAELQLRRLRSTVVIPALSYKETLDRARRQEPFRAIEFSFLRGFEEIRSGETVSVVRKAPKTLTDQEFIKHQAIVRSRVDPRDKFEILGNRDSGGLMIVATFEREGLIFDGVTNWELSMPNPDPEPILDVLTGAEAVWSTVNERFPFPLYERTPTFWNRLPLHQKLS